MNTVSLAFLIVGVVNPYIELTNSGSTDLGYLMNDPDKLRDLGAKIILSNPGVNVNWLLTSLIVYVVALVAVAAAKSLEE